MSGGAGSVVAAVRRTGLYDPFALSALGLATTLWGPSLAASYGAATTRYPGRIAVVDELGSLTYRQLDHRAGLAAAGLRRRGLGRGDGLAILCRNHRGFVEANLAAAKLGCRPVLLNTGLSAAQLTEVLQRESVAAVVADREFADRLAGAPVPVIVAAPEDDPERTFPQLDARRPLLPRPGLGGAAVPIILTAGTTGVPKGTLRSLDPGAMVGAFGFIEAIPYRRGDVIVLPAPLFHAWGFSQLAVAATLSATVVLRRRFDPRLVIDDLEAHGATVLAAVPVMLHRILDADEEAEIAGTIDPDRDLSGLRVVATSGSALPGNLAGRWMDRFGDNLYNLYGSTECGQATVATPADLRAHPDTAGRPLRGVDVRLLDGDDREVPVGRPGEIMVGGASKFDGYTDGGVTRRSVGDLLATGDRGRFDDDGRLFVLGRSDDLIVTGGENVYPVTVERALLEHQAVTAVAVVGVDDTELGQRIRAVVVTGGDQRVVDRATAGAMTRRLKAHLDDRVAAHERPREFVYVTDLPRNPAGKVLRNQLVGARRAVPFQHRPGPGGAPVPATSEGVMA